MIDDSGFYVPPQREREYSNEGERILIRWMPGMPRENAYEGPAHRPGRYRNPRRRDYRHRAPQRRRTDAEKSFSRGKAGGRY